MDTKTLPSLNIPWHRTSLSWPSEAQFVSLYKLRHAHVFQKIPLRICKPRGFIFSAVGPNLCHIWLNTFFFPRTDRRQLSAMHWRSELPLNGGAFCLIFRGEWRCRRPHTCSALVMMSSGLQPLPRLSAGWQSGVFQGHNTAAVAHLLCKWRSASCFRLHIVTIFYIEDWVKEMREWNGKRNKEESDNSSNI